MPQNCNFNAQRWQESWVSTQLCWDIPSGGKSDAPDSNFDVPRSNFEFFIKILNFDATLLRHTLWGKSDTPGSLASVPRSLNYFSKTSRPRMASAGIAKPAACSEFAHHGSAANVSIRAKSATFSSIWVGWPPRAPIEPLKFNEKHMLFHNFRLLVLPSPHLYALQLPQGSLH